MFNLQACSTLQAIRISGQQQTNVNGCVCVCVCDFAYSIHVCVSERMCKCVCGEHRPPSHITMCSPSGEHYKLK